MRRPIDPAGEFKRHEPPPYKVAARRRQHDDGGHPQAGSMYPRPSGWRSSIPTGRPCGVLPKPQPDKPLTSVMLSGANREYLYITNGDKIYRRKVQAIGPPGFYQAPH